MIPAEAAEEIAARSKVDELDFDLLRHETDIVGYPILPLVHQLVKMCGEAGRYVHWGATTRTSWTPPSCCSCATPWWSRRTISPAAHPRRPGGAPPRHADGRPTHLQQALPVTFGYKVAVWLAMFDRHAERLEQLRPRVLVGQFAGAAGTLASLGEPGSTCSRR